MIAAEQLHRRLREDDFKARLMADGIEVRSQASAAAISGVGPLETIDFSTRYSVFGRIGASAIPLLRDAGGAVAGVQIDAADFKAVYLALDLRLQNKDTARSLLTTALGLLHAVPAAAQARVVEVRGVQPSAGLEVLQPRLVLRNGGKHATGRLRVDYRVLDGQASLVERTISVPGLAPGQEREMVLPMWRPPHEADYTLQFGLPDSKEGYSWSQELQVADTRGVFESAPIEGGAKTNGAGLFDADGDGDLDLFLIRLDEPNRLLRNRAGQLQYDADAGLDEDGRGRGLAVGDYDGDGDMDVYVVNERENHFYLNRGDGRFAKWDAPEIQDKGSGRSAGFFDYDGDGDLDLYLVNSLSANRLYRNDDGVFVEVAAQAGVDDDGQGRGLAVGDYDSDGYPDMLVANQQNHTPSRLYRNLEGKGFRDEAAAAGLLFKGSEVAGVFGDYDGDGLADIFLSNEAGDNALWRNRGEGAFEPVETDLGQNGVGAALFDYDNDGDLDFASTALNASLGGDQLYHNRGKAGFTPVGRRLGLRDESTGRAVSFGDLDGDGRQDLVVADYEGAYLYRNALRQAGWLGLELRGPGLNPNAVGARVELFSGGVRQVREMQSSYGYGSQIQPLLHFGVGSAARVDSLRVIWPDGLQSLRLEVPSNQRLLLSRPLAALPAKAVEPRFGLGVNTPNPFNTQTAISFSLPSAGRVELAVYDALGQRVRTLVDQERAAGRYRVVWNGRDDGGQGVASGVYFYRLEAGGRAMTQKLLLLK